MVLLTPGRLCPCGTICHLAGHPVVQVRGAPPSAFPVTPIATDPVTPRAAFPGHAESRAPASGGRDAEARPWESPGAGGSATGLGSGARGAARARTGGPGSLVPGAPRVEAALHRHVCAVFRHPAYAAAPGAHSPSSTRRGRHPQAVGRAVRPDAHRRHAAASNPVLRASFFSSSSACFSICRMRSRVRPCSLPTSVSVRSRPSSMP